MEKFRIGFSVDIHQLSEGNGIYVGGIYIPCNKKSVAHSDGDCLLHAIAESILGALALGDLGKFFPPSDESIKGIASSKIAEFAVSKMFEQNYKINNVDCSIVLESPKLAKYMDEIKTNIAKLLFTDITNVSIKAGTNEKIGELGQGKAIQCFSTVMLVSDNKKKIFHQFLYLLK